MGELIKHNVEGTIKAKEQSKTDERTELKNVIQRLPGRIKSLRQQKLELDFSMTEVNRSIKRIESVFSCDINGEKEGTKLKFSNDTSRKSELMKRVGADETSIALRTEFDDAKQQSKNLDVEIEFENNRFKAARRIVDLIINLEN